MKAHTKRVGQDKEDEIRRRKLESMADYFEGLKDNEEFEVVGSRLLTPFDKIKYPVSWNGAYWIIHINS
jgi:hypothetical protein